MQSRNSVLIEKVIIAYRVSDQRLVFTQQTALGTECQTLLLQPPLESRRVNNHPGPALWS